MNKGFKKKRGLAVLEFTLFCGMLLTTAAIVADLYFVNQLRGQYDRISHNLASVLSVQRYIAAKDLAALLNIVVSEADTDSYELNIYKVNTDRRMDWLPLKRGTLKGVCSPLSEGRYFTGGMPEEDKKDDSVSLIVVQLCRQSAGLTPLTALISSKAIEVVAYNRMRYHDIEIDDELADELSVPDDGE